MVYKKILSRIVSTARTIKKLPGTLRERVYMTSHGRGYAPHPRMLAFPLTAQCNYNCNFCEIVGVRHVLKESQRSYYANELSLEHFMLFSDVIRHAHKIDFGGMTALGEPLLAKDFQHIILAIRRLNPKVKLMLTTNGSLLTHEVADLLASVPPVRVTLSLHAASQDVYQQVMASGFAKVVDNIRYFCEHTRNDPRVKTTINFGLGKFNLPDAERIIVLSKELGIDKVHLYPYYKSPNIFMEDVSLYSEPEIANQAIDAAYAKAEAIGQQIVPRTPAYIRSETEVPSHIQPYSGGCMAPFENFLFKSDPFHERKIGFCVCNRIVLFLLDLNGRVTAEDLRWMWNHPVIKAMRFPQKRVPDICRFCKDPETPLIRSLDHAEYKKRRDTAVRNDLSRFQADRLSPGGSIELLAENIFSLE